MSTAATYFSFDRTPECFIAENLGAYSTHQLATWLAAAEQQLRHASLPKYVAKCRARIDELRAAIAAREPQPAPAPAPPASRSRKAAAPPLAQAA